jgi:hypothetical protein
MKLNKLNTFTNDIVFIDGLWGTGKSILAPIISSMKGVEKIKAESLYEYMGWLYHLGNIEKDAAVWMMRTYADSAQYHNRIGREINLRWSDDTGLKHVSNKWNYLKRLFGSEGDEKVREINSKNLAFSVMSHMLMLTPDLLIPAYGNRVKVVEMMRHPLYMINHFSSYLDRFESSREFTMAYYHQDVKVPWFVNDWEEAFVQGNIIERAVLCITKLYPWLDTQISKARNEGLQILELSFEEVVFETNLAIEKLNLFMGRKHSGQLNRILNSQKLPRKTIAKGNGHVSYGWQTINIPESEFYRQTLEIVMNNCSPNSINDMLALINWYNIKYPSKLAQFSSNNSL